MKKIISILISVCILFTFAQPAFAEAGEKSGLPEIRITLDNDVTLAQINSGSKDTKYVGNTAALVDGENEEIFEDVEIKGRGNYTWNQPMMIKKPYQLKFSSKTKVFGMDKAKKWVLLANYADGTLMRNKLVFDAARAIGMNNSPESVWADLYVDDEYIGNYLVCEKNEVGSNRVNLKDDYGVLCEIDGNYGTQEEFYFKSEVNGTVIVLSESVADDAGEPDSVSEVAFEKFRTKFNNFETLLYSGSATWEQISSLIDVESFINYYFIQELTEDPDGLRSSFFLYSDGDSDVIHLGPVWDYDSSLGAYAAESLGGNTGVDYSYNIKKYMGQTSVDWYSKLFGYDEFCTLAVNRYNSVIRPVFEGLSSQISSYAAQPQFAKSVAMNFAKWTDIYGHGSVFGDAGHKYGASFADEVNYLKNFVTARVEYLNVKYSKTPVILTPWTEPEPPSPPEPPVVDPSADCSHICHTNNEFLRFIWNIVNFFCRIWGINQYCSCGKAHW